MQQTNFRLVIHLYAIKRVNYLKKTKNKTTKNNQTNKKPKQTNKQTYKQTKFMLDFLFFIYLTTLLMFHFLESASPYYFGTTDLTCMMRSDRRKREIPQRSKLLWAHRFIYYKGYYFEFGSNSKYNFVLCL